ncbi:Hypp2477 [Branchiostoma lanceolatum]|uniref:Hypp2477 protein n=1 Tax=Branchiostoma lanceolatum TaxID=7740 RepID=A0A8J9ZQW6_BRALA|nr:Hypp2477 [Branchiostoma lanceolatum]
MLYLLRPKVAGKAQRLRGDAAQLLAELLQEHWLFCNVYTIATKNISTRILKFYEEFVTLLQTRKQRRNDQFFKKAEAFNNKAHELFDVFCQDSAVLKSLEKKHGVTMTDMEWEFLADQRTERKMYCEDFVDRKWMKAMERRQRDMQALDKMREDARREQEQNKLVASSQDSEESETDSQKMETDADVILSSSDESNGNCDKETCKEELPPKYQHIRESIRKVRPEFYETVDKLQSCYHMSKAQASAAVVVVENQLFGRRWKSHGESDVIDLDTLPESKSVRYAGKSIEVLALDEIVKEIMDCDEQVVVTYSHDGSKKQGAGSFSVQGITVKGRYRSLPTLSIASESRQNLADLKVAMLQILEAASGVASKTLFEKIDFVITDQTSHNFNVDELVAESLESEHIPDHLFCNVHPTLMFNRVITKLWAEIENTLGRDKIYSNFLVNATTSASSVTEQALDCMTRLINHDFDHKPWNKSRDFDIHATTKQICEPEG